MNEVKTMQEAYRVFDLLGIKEVTKECQRRKGTEVWELPFKTMYSGGYKEVNRFTLYKNGYIRKMLVNNKGASYTCYQLNRVRKVASFVKDYKWDGEEMIPTGKYRKIYNNERVMIDTHRDRLIYLCNYILKNYYRNGKMNLVGEYTQSRIKIIHSEWWKKDRINDQLPFETIQSEDSKHGISPNHSVQVIINGHRYNLS